MTALGNIELGKEIIYLARLKPTIRLADWQADTSVGPTTYKHRLPANFVDSFRFDSTTFLAHPSLASFSVSTASRYYFDINAGYIYADFLGKTPFDLDNYIVCNYEVSVASKEIPFFRDPTDSGSEQTQYLPSLSSGFRVSKSVDNAIDGLMPAVTSSVDLVNIDYALSFLLVRSTLSKKEVLVYVISGERLASNALLIFSGKMNSVSFDDASISIGVSDQIFDFDGTYDYRGLEPYDKILNSTVRPLIDQGSAGRYKRVLYGVNNCVEGINTNYSATGGYTTATNSIFEMCHHFYSDANTVTQARQSALAFTVQAGTNTTYLYLNSVAGLNVGDEILNSSYDNYGWVQEVDTVLNRVKVPVGTAASVGATVRRDRIAFVAAVSKKTGYFTYLYRRDTGLVNGFDYKVDSTANQNLRVNINPSTYTDIDLDGPANTRVVARIYGEKTSLPNDGFSLYHTGNTNIATKWHQVLYEYLVQEVGISTTEIDSDSFSALDSTDQPTIGIMLPPTPGDQMPKHREVIGPILAANNASLSQGSDGKLRLSVVEKITTTDFEVNKDDIISLSYSEDYIDTAKEIVCQYGPGDLTGGAATDSPYSVLFSQFSTQPGYLKDTFQRVTVSSIFNSNISNQISTPFFKKAAASAFSEKYFYIKAYPFGVITIGLPIFYLTKNIGDTVSINRSLLPGVFSVSSTNEIVGTIIGIDFDGNQVTLKVWTQQGIQDSEGVW